MTGSPAKTIDDGDAVLATSPEVVLDAKRQGKLALLAALEGGDGLEARVENMRDLYRRGLRLLQLVHFRANELGHIQTYPYSPGGLTPFGREAVHEANRLGIDCHLVLAGVGYRHTRDTLAGNSPSTLPGGEYRQTQ